MKKLFMFLFVALLGLSVFACKKEKEPEELESNAISYAEYLNAKDDDPVVIKGYIQAKNVFKVTDASVDENAGTASLYLADRDGAYYVYGVQLKKDEYDKLEIGALVEITGTKASWKGEVEVSNPTLRALGGKKQTFDAKNIDDKLDKAEDYMNQLVSLKGWEVVGRGEAGDPFTYTWGGGGERGSDLYIDVKKGEQTFTFVVESDLCNENTDVYKAVEALKVGDTIDLEGFAYWYNTLQLQLTKVTKK